MFIQRHFLTIIVALSVLFAVAMGATVFQKGPTPPLPPAPVTQPVFRAYWFGGKAELNRYRLEQAPETDPGEAVLVFRTEQFRTDTQVKAASEAGYSRSVPVLTSNYSRRFGTGLAAYSHYTSVFTPAGNTDGSPTKFPNTLKVSTSSQRLDGHSYLEVCYKDNGYQVSSGPAVDRETPEVYAIDKALLADELFNRIRLNPAALPTGNIHLIPGTLMAGQQRLASLAATAALDTAQGMAWVRTYTPTPAVSQAIAYSIKYPDNGEALLIVFEAAFPHRILGWEDSYKTKDRLLTSRAVLASSEQAGVR